VVTHHRAVDTLGMMLSNGTITQEMYDAGTKFRVLFRSASLGTMGTSALVRLPGKTAAWIQSSDVVADPKPLSIPESIELAKRFLGLPYLWGGTSSFGFDCSGFTQMLLRARGFNMPRDADQQAAWKGLIAVDRTDLQPGDLLFFGSSPRTITHTGMFIGDGQFIQATTDGHPVIQISRLDDQPWTRLLVASRRTK